MAKACLNENRLRLEAVRRALEQHRQAAGRPLSWAIAGLAHYLEEAQKALELTGADHLDSVRALADEFKHHRATVEQAGQLLQQWWEDFRLRAAPAETYTSEARLSPAEAVHLLAEG